jgi:hypothetical protein
MAAMLMALKVQYVKNLPFRRFSCRNQNNITKNLPGALPTRSGGKLSQGELMAEAVLDQILVDLRNEAVKHYPERGELKNLRVVGHTPKNDHFIYDACIDFAEGSERVAIKVYRSGKAGANAKSIARQENANLQYVNQTLVARKKLP